MANRATHRRTLAAPEPKPSMDSNILKKQTKPSTSQHISNSLEHPTMSNKTSGVNPSHRVRTSQRSNSQQSLPALTDARLQAKAMSVSVLVDSSKPSLKPTKELAFKDKSKKPSKDLDKKRVEVLVVKNKKKEEAQEELVGFEFDSRRLSVSLNSSGGGGRRSLSGSQIQLADVFACNGVKVVSADMPPFMQIHAVECARKTHDSLEKFTSKTLALTLKKEFDGVYGPAWHCIVGTSFGSFVTHSMNPSTVVGFTAITSTGDRKS